MPKVAGRIGVLPSGSWSLDKKPPEPRQYACIPPAASAAGREAAARRPLLFDPVARRRGKERFEGRGATDLCQLQATALRLGDVAT